MEHLHKYTDLNLQPFFPEYLNVCDISNKDEEIYVELKSTTKEIICPCCKKKTTKYRATHRRDVQDLPVFGKRTYLHITLREFACTNSDCLCNSFTETLEDFLEPNSRVTQRLADLIVELALNTSCESAARILQAMKVKVSGDTVIRRLVQRYKRICAPKSGSCIGIDDFALKKGETYGTIIVDGESHIPLAILEGRDGEALKKWLRDNQHVTTVTRDRASAYAKAVEEILPEAMQIADRFHLYQNLMEAVKKVIKEEIHAERLKEKTDGKKNNFKCG